MQVEHTVPLRTRLFIALPLLPPTLFQSRETPDRRINAPFSKAFYGLYIYNITPTKSVVSIKLVSDEFSHLRAFEKKKDFSYSIYLSPPFSLILIQSSYTNSLK